MSITFDVNSKALRSLSSKSHKTTDIKTAIFKRTNDIKQRYKKVGDPKGHQYEMEDVLTGKESTIEAAAGNTETVIEGKFSHPLMEAAHLAYSDHYPLVLTPDTVWLCIAQGFANHVNENAEALRSRFVAHEGKEKIIVDVPFVKGSPDNDWQWAFKQFSERLSQYIGKKRDLVVSNFSTTTAIEQAVSEIVLMDSMKAYFSYGCRTMCGIPSITLTGTVDDWKSIQTRVQALSEFDLSWWTDELLPVTQHFINAAMGNVPPGVWNEFYKVDGGSGGPYISGWANTLFPYVEGRDKMVKNRYLNGATKGPFSGNTSDNFHQGLSKVPFEWNYYGTIYDMEFLGGFTGVHQDTTTLALTPALGWAIREKQD